MSDSPYAPPSSAELVRPEVVPQAVIDSSITPRLLVTLGVMLLIELVLTLYVIVDDTLVQLQVDPIGTPLVVGIAATIGNLLWIYVYYRWRQVLNLWVGAEKANKYIYALIVLTVIIGITAQVDRFGPADQDMVMLLLQYGLLCLIGICMLLYGIVLVRCSTELSLFKAYAILSIITGALMASVLLIMLSLPVMIISEVVFALMLFGMARSLMRARGDA